MKSPEPAPKGELIGYARVSTPDQVLTLQTDALEKVGCLNIYSEHVSGAAKNRPQLDLAIKDLRPGDTLVVWRLDRLARSMRDLYMRLDQIKDAGGNFKSLTEQFDFSSAVGQVILGFLALMAQFEHQLTIERTKAGMDALKARGKHMGRERKVTDEMKEKIITLVVKGWQIKDIAAKFKIHPQTIYSNFPKGKRGILAVASRKKRQ